MINIKNNIDKIKAQIQQACQENVRLTADAGSANIPSPVTLLAVSKTKPAELIEQAHLAGQNDFGENYLQEAIDKITQLAHLPQLTWHFIGPIQSNKTKQIAHNFSWVHSIDRERIALRLNQHLTEDGSHNTPLNVCLQVNISNEASKSGVAIKDVFTLAEIVNNCDKLTLRGLMAVPEKNADKACYQEMQILFAQLKKTYPSVDTLSLGMSSDLEQAIAHGSTMVRIGTAIFGERVKN
ncbi:YggS family pyridoxal phosphate-dependent enzyme [Colwellia sp. E2M01]|uniref:YggS family pyridoxal phosphate-dependent enzyme n=1 Tax=Colwellia sp. E2M01 TaxID=2841561 RepID=UPI001C0A4C3E|nr:YggS family pyridoxal phosphate-dependent enzyme [Colwellia sp. E2M01]MBU2871990.1 YggS family pyridoxal phosphate-dependent enzyme [Colwellia sp. E2M01]